ncbi:MAG: hypothetical protein AMXMBFR7_24110 [Planctomycetota bacterium]
MQIRYCETCGVRVSEREVESGEALETGGKVRCPQCKPQQVAVADRGMRKSRSKIIALGSDRAKSSETSVGPAQRESPAVRRPPVPSHHGAQDSNKTVGLTLAAGGLVLLGLAFMLLRGGEAPARPAPREPAVAQESIPRETRLAARPAPDPVSGQSEAAQAPAPVEPGPPSAFERLARFEGLDPEDARGRVVRIEAFLVQETDPLHLARARQLLAEWQAKVSAATGPVAVEVGRPAAPDEPVAPDLAPATTAAPTPETDRGVRTEPAAPSATTESSEFKGWEAGAEECASYVVAFQQHREAHAYRQMLAEVFALVRRMRTSEALAELARRAQTAGAGEQAERAKRDRSDLEALSALRRQALDAAKALVGKEVELWRGSTPIRGTLLKSDPAEGVSLRLADGPELTMAPEQLNARDVERWIAPDPNAADATQARLFGLLHLVSGEHAAAMGWYERLPDPVRSEYRTRAALLDLTGAGLRFDAAWLAADEMRAAGKWQEAYEAYANLERTFGATAAWSECSKKIEEAAQRMKWLSKPIAPGLIGSYYRTREAKPETLVVTRIDSTIDFDWGGKSPAPSMPGEQISIVWTGMVHIQVAGSYEFALTSDDGSRLYLDGQVVVENYADHPAKRVAGTVVLAAGWHPLRLAYYNGTSFSSCKMSWTPPGAAQDVLVPAEVLGHDARVAPQAGVQSPAAPPAVTEPPAQTPPDAPAAPAGPKLPEGPTVFLSQLAEFDVKVGHGTFGKNGATGYESGHKISVGGQPSPHGLSTHPGAEPATVSYRLDKQFKSLQGYVALNDTTKRSNRPLLFRIYGDDRLLWQSKSVQVSNRPEAFAVPLAGVGVLRLEVEARGDSGYAHGVWIEPLLRR